MKPWPRLADVAVIRQQQILDERGRLTIHECGREVPFPIARVFTLSAAKGTERGYHAHRQCSQLLVCLAGSCRIVCDDGRERREILLDRADTAILVVPGIWVETTMEADDAVLMVLCDRPYEEADYIRDRDEFLRLACHEEQV